ncbi:hypothetical protein BLOT_016389, partial [Blomia tropicalis]
FLPSLVELNDNKWPLSDISRRRTCVFVCGLQCNSLSILVPDHLQTRSSQFGLCDGLLFLFGRINYLLKPMYCYR